MTVKTIYYGIITFFGLIGTMIASWYGGWTHQHNTLLIIMGIDFLSGLAVGVTGKSQKTENGGLKSSIGFAGLTRKGLILGVVLIGARLDLLIGSDYIQTSVILAYIVNELLSIAENAALLGLPLPSVLTKIIEILKGKEDKLNDKST